MEAARPAKHGMECDPSRTMRLIEREQQVRTMPMNRRGISATQLAREYGVRLNEFADDVVNLLAQLDPSEVTAEPAERCRESCAAVWTAMVAALEASSLSAAEREQITPMLLEVLLPFWRKHCADEPDITALLAKRAAHYLERRDPASQIKTAANLVNGLMLRLGIAQSTQVELGETLAALFAHRMLGDIHRINDVRARFGIELPVVAALAAIVQVTMNYHPVLKLLRLV
jgi:hypothetical protein